MVTGNIKTQAYQNLVTASAKTQKTSAKTDFSQSIQQASGSYAKTDNKSQNVSKDQTTKAKDNSTVQTQVKSDKTDKNTKSAEVKSTDVKETKKEEIDPEVAAVLVNSQQQEAVVDENAVSDFLQDIAQQLEVSVDDLMKSMENLNLQVTDLQDAQNVLKLMTDVKELSGAAEVLTSPELMETFKDINSQAKEFVQQQNQIADMSGTVEISNLQETQQTSLTNDMGSDSNAQQEKSEQKDVQTDNTDLVNKNVQNNVTNLNELTDRIQELVTDRTDVETAENITKQVVNQVKLTMKNDVTSLQMQLYPEHLGKVSIQVVSKNGVLTAQIAAENEVAKAALESQLTTLKESFDSQGIKVQSVEVMVSSRGFEQNQQSDTDNSEQERKHGRQARKNILMGMNGEDDSQLPEDNSLQETLGNTVSYTA